jgi:hypothetical protein
VFYYPIPNARLKTSAFFWTWARTHHQIRKPPETIAPHYCDLVSATMCSAVVLLPPTETTSVHHFSQTGYYPLLAKVIKTLLQRNQLAEAITSLQPNRVSPIVYTCVSHTVNDTTTYCVASVQQFVPPWHYYYQLLLWRQYHHFSQTVSSIGWRSVHFSQNNWRLYIYVSYCRNYNVNVTS